MLDLIKFILECLMEESQNPPSTQLTGGYLDNKSSRIFCILAETELFWQIFGSESTKFMATLDQDVAALLTSASERKNVRARLEPWLCAQKRFYRQENGRAASKFADAAGIQQGDGA